MPFPLRPPAATPRADGPECPRITIRHPGYTDNNNILLQLVATDAHPHDNSANVIPYDIVYTACALIAGNRFDGFVSTARRWEDAQPDCSTKPNFLNAADYYFHVPPPPTTLDAPYHYPIVPNFREWDFPHRSEPSLWQRPAIGTAPVDQTAKERDPSCRLTNHREVRETAHIIPHSEGNWFSRNSMDQYGVGNVGVDVLNAPENTIMLRQDVHSLWDTMKFSIVPKTTCYALENGQDQSQGQWGWYAHVHSSSSELQHLYHNLELQPLSYIRRQFLLARFAWDIFPMVRGFLQRAVQRHLLLRDNKAAWKSAEECRAFCEGQGQHRSSPSRKSPKRHQNDMPNRGTRDLEGEHQEEDHGLDSGVSVRSRSHERWADDNSSDDQHADGSESGEDSDIDDEERFLRRHRAEQAAIDRRLSDPDPSGHKRRREQATLEHESDRGRKRIRG